MKKILFAGIGIGLLPLGLLGLALPILPGLVLLFLAVMLLNKEPDWFAKWGRLGNKLFNKIKNYLRLVKI